MRLSKLLIVLAILLLPVVAFAEKGIGIQNQFDVNTATFKNGLALYVSAFDTHIRAFAAGDYGEDLNSADKQWDASADFLYVPYPQNGLGMYMELGGNSQWLDTEFGIENYARAAVGFGGIYQFGEKKDNNTGVVTGHGSSLYLGYRAKSLGTDKMTHEIVARMIFGF